MLKYIFFDIDDTLFPSSEFSSLARKNALNAMLRLGLESDYKTLHDELLRIIEEKGSNYPNHFDDLCAMLSIKNPSKYVAAAVAAYHDTKTSIHPFPKVPFMLLKLREQGYKIYAATDGNSKKQWDKLIRLGIALYFNDVFVSEEIGRKKDNEFFSIILAKLGAKPEDCLMVGDREESDILPAKAVGMKTMRVLQGKYKDVPSKADYVSEDVSAILEFLQSF